MRRVYSDLDRMMAGHVKAVLESEGIPCLMKNEALVGGVGELPPTACWPEVWIVDDADYVRARQLVEELVAAPDHKADDWRCPRCGERVDGELALCWHCGRSRPEP